MITIVLGIAYIRLMERVFNGEMSIKDIGTEQGKETMSTLFKEELKRKR